MAASVGLPPEIRIIDSLEVVRYFFPRRRAPQTRLLGAIGGAFIGLALAWGVTIWMTRSFGGGDSAAILVVIGLLLTSSVLVNVLFLFMGHADVEVGGGELRAIECFGPFRRCRRLPVIRVSRLVVGQLPPRAGGYDNAWVKLANEPGLTAILAEVDGGKPLVLAPAYPFAWLLALTQDLARRVKDSAPDPLFDPPAPKTEVVDTAVEASCFYERPHRPAGSDIVVEHHPDEITFFVQPRGVRRDARGCIFLLVGLIFLAGASICILVAAWTVPDHGQAWGAFWICLICGLILSIGAIEIGRRRVVMVVAGSTLRVTTASPLKYREYFWSRAELEDIRTGPSAWDINDDHRLPELQIHLKTGAKFGFLVGRDADELAFLATELRHSLHLTAMGVRH